MWSSYSLWREFMPQIGLEEFHCHKRRGYSRVVSQDNNNVKLLKNQDTIPQKIGKLSQEAIYELYHHQQYINHAGIEVIASEFLHLNQEDKEVQKRVFKVLQNYIETPFLEKENREVIFLESGNEKPNKVFIEFNNIKFTVYFKFDCVVRERSGLIHIIDFKTGQKTENHDPRQALIYLLVSQYMAKYKNKKVIASFYNLDLNQESEICTANSEELEFTKINLAKIALKHEQEIKEYRSDPNLFQQLFPASPGKGCSHCPYHSICQDYQDSSEYVNNVESK
ncbi:MAG: PD-(D/E)XK nuclease family protein [Crocosphaera sp.]